MLSLVIFVAALAPGPSAHASPHPPTPTPVASARPQTTATPVAPTAVARARAFYEQLRGNAVDRSLLTPQFATELSPAVAATYAKGLAGLGGPTAFRLRDSHDAAGVSMYDYSVSVPAGTLSVTIGIDDTTGLIARYYVRRSAGTAAP